jgi:hypothetical protein
LPSAWGFDRSAIRPPSWQALDDLVGPRDEVDGRDVDVELLMIELVHRLL